MKKVWEVYPGSLKMEDFENMLVCLKKYEFELVTPFDTKSNIIDTSFFTKIQNGGNCDRQPCWQSSQLQICLVVHELRIACYDKVSPNQLVQRKVGLIENEELVRRHLDFTLHHLFKRHQATLNSDKTIGLHSKGITESRKQNLSVFVTTSMPVIQLDMLNNPKNQAFQLMRKQHQIENQKL